MIAKSAFDPKTSYHVHFKVYYKTTFGESICILGSIPELGTWKEFRMHMKWTDGHIWVTEKPLVTNNYYFQYKYVLLDAEKTKLIAWERGVDRIADLEILPKADMQSSSMYKSYDLSNNNAYNTENSQSSVKKVELNDEWETYTVTFSMSHPIDDMHDEMVLMGDQAGTNNLHMHKLPRELKWMDVKYGKLM